MEEVFHIISNYGYGPETADYSHWWVKAVKVKRDGKSVDYQILRTLSFWEVMKVKMSGDYHTLHRDGYQGAREMSRLVRTNGILELEEV